MAELSTIARPYAGALFEAARSKNATDAWLPLLESLASAGSNPQVAGVAADPRLSDRQAFDLLAALVGQPLPQELASFLGLLIENDRLAALPEVAAQFRRLKNDAEGSADCLIETAFALSDAQLAELTALLARKFSRRLKAKTQVEPRLIGGVRVTVGDQVLDNSVLARLDAMRIQLTT
jgi:F-type H+-transporting ATPase subunit delta